MGVIRLNNMNFYGYHGVYEFEKEQGTNFEIDLELKGVGYRCQAAKDKVTLSLGFSHPIVLPLPKGVEVSVEANTNIKVAGIDKEEVGFIASKIRSFRPPEPYNGKSVLYKNEVILRKAGKAGKK